MNHLEAALIGQDCEDPIEMPTPRTDAEESACSADPSSAYMQMRDHARQLERESYFTRRPKEDRYPGIGDDLRLCKRYLRVAARACANSVNHDTLAEWQNMGSSPHEKYTPKKRGA